MKRLLYSLCLLLTLQSLYSQTGVEFWFVAPEITSGHGDEPIALRISTYDSAATITVSQPANGSFTTKTISLGSYATTSLDLTLDIATIENSPADQVMNYGILIESTSDISAYYEIERSNNTDIFALKAENALGTEFWVPGQEFWKSGTYTPMPTNAIDIVATQNNTSITITPANDAVNHTAGIPYTVVLNRGETYSIVASGSNANQKLGGTKITSTAPIAVTVSDDSAYRSSYGGCKDVLGDQLIPITKIGTDYIVMKGFLSKSGAALDDKVYVLALHANTSVYLDGSGTASTVLQQGEQFEISLSNNSVYIQADKNVYVLHVTGFGCEVGGAVLPSIQCTGSREVTFTRSKGGSGNDFYMIVLVPNGGEGSFAINGSTTLLTPGDFTGVAGTGGAWLMARKYFTDAEIRTGFITLVTNSFTKFHLGIINGGSRTGCMYGYFSDFGKVLTEPIYHF